MNVIQDAAVPGCQSKVSAVPLKAAVELSEQTSLNGLSGVSVITSLPVSKVEQSEDWKHLETEDWKSWKNEVSGSAAAASSPVQCGEDAGKTEPVTAVSNAEVCDMTEIKTEQGLDYSIARSSASLSEVRSGRVIASVAPCTSVQANEQLSTLKVPLSGPPPLLHSTSHDPSATSPLPTSVIQSPIIIDETSTASQNDSDDSEQELRNCSPSPEPRQISDECHRSKNAMCVFLLLFYF